MIQLQELCGAVDTTKVVSAAALGDAYFAVGSTVYKKNRGLKEWVRADFPVNRIEINKTGEFIALSGDNAVAIYSNDARWQYEETYREGVYKTLWHPLGVDHSCLVVLSAGHVRSIWLSPAGNLTDTFDFSRNAVGAQDGPQYANTMTFGPNNATGDFTLYLSTNEGNIFAISPFLPPKFQLTSAEYNKLVDYIATAQFSHQTADDAAVYKYQAEWIKSIDSQMINPQVKNGEVYYVLDTPDPDPLCCQGPFRINPYPEMLYDADFHDITAFSHNDLHFLVQSSNTCVVFLLLDEPTPGYWAYSKSAKYDPCLALVQVLKVSGSPSLQVTNNLIWGHTAKSVLLLKPTWVTRLETSLETGVSPKLEKTEIKTYPKSVIAGSLLAATITPVLDLNKQETVGYVRGFKNQQIDPTAPQYPKEQSFKNDLPEDISTLISEVRLTPCGPVAGLVEDNEESLGKVDDISDAYLVQVAKIYRCITMAFDAINLQKIELNRQLKSAHNLEESVANLGDNTQLNRLETIYSRQKKILKRAKDLETRVQDSLDQEQPIGRFEKRWFKELDSISDMLTQFSNRRDTVAQGLKTVDAGAHPDIKPQDLRSVLFKLQSLGNDIGQLKSKMHPST